MGIGDYSIIARHKENERVEGFPSYAVRSTTQHQGRNQAGLKLKYRGSA
jgi:hypothetical protein